MSRRALARVADHDDVVSGAFEQFRQDVARRAGAILAVDAGVGGEALNVNTGDAGDFRKNVGKAGIGGLDAEALAVPNYAGG